MSPPFPESPLVRIPKSDQAILDDYEQFRTARAQVHIQQSEWHRMSKKTKRALAQMFAAAEKQFTNKMTP